MKQITERQQQVIDFISEWIATHGYSPSFKDIGDGMGFSIKAAYDHLSALRKKGAIKYDDGIARSIRIVKEA